MTPDQEICPQTASQKHNFLHTQSGKICRRCNKRWDKDGKEIKKEN